MFPSSVCMFICSGMGPDSRVLVRKSRKQSQQYYRLYKVWFNRKVFHLQSTSTYLFFLLWNFLPSILVHFANFLNFWAYTHSCRLVAYLLLPKKSILHMFLYNSLELVFWEHIPYFNLHFGTNRSKGNHLSVDFCIILLAVG